MVAFFGGITLIAFAVVAFFILSAFFNDSIFGIVFTAVAGIMVYISLDELLPTAEEYGRHYIAMGGVVVGMLVMASSLLLMR